MARDPLAYWVPEDRLACETVSSCEVLAGVGIQILTRMKHDVGDTPVGMVCGPISTGGLGSQEKNLQALTYWIAKLVSSGHPIFSQLPFESALWRISNVSDCLGEFALLEGFYLKLFQSGLIGILYFLQNWQTSVGATWEHDQALALGIERKYLEGNLPF